MAKPKHRRCADCNVVTARYTGTRRAGAVSLVMWVVDPANGEVPSQGKHYCRTHATERELIK